MVRTQSICRTTCALLFVFLLVGCSKKSSCEHIWQEATCSSPQTCSQCGETQGDPKAHQWTEPTCLSPQHCSDCGLVSGDLSDHQWMDATCFAPQTCRVCGETQGSYADHNWSEANCTTLSTCQNCGEKRPGFGDHSWQPASQASPGYCAFCGELHEICEEHQWEFSSSVSPAYCRLCGENAPPCVEHQWIDATCLNPRFCKMCGQQQGPKSIAHVWQSATCKTAQRCVVCYKTSGQPVNHTCSEDGKCRVCALDVTDYKPVSLLHAFGSWAFDGTSAYRVCEYCGIRDHCRYVSLTEYEIIKSALIGLWAEGADNRLTFSEDGTFSGWLGGEVTGTWKIQAVRNNYADETPMGAVNLNYYINGIQTERSASLHIDSSLEHYLYLSHDYLEMTKEPEDTDAVFSYQTATEAIVGRWDSRSMKLYGKDWTVFYGDIVSGKEMTTEYYIEFYADGTYYAQLDRAFRGTWSYQPSTSLHFSHKAEDKPAESLDDVFFINPDGTLGFTDYNRGIWYTFSRMDAGQIQTLNHMIDYGKQLFTGVWYSQACYSTYIQGDAVSLETPLSGVSWTVHPDGTLTNNEVLNSNTIIATNLNWSLSDILQTEHGFIFRYAVWNEDLHLIRENIYLDSSGLFMQEPIQLSDTGYYHSYSFRTE